MRAPRLGWAALLALACGSPGTPLAAPSADAIVDEAGGAQIVFLPRATEGRLWLSLWIDAGARDADPPQLATVAAWTAAHEAPVEARVLPDGVELSRPCARSELDACLRSLADVVRAREPDDEVLAAAMRRLAATRERAAPDDGRTADALAIAALLGHAADPLGAPADDARVDAARVGSFLSAHAGGGRLLLVAVGDVDAGELRRSVLSAFEGLPRASSPRAERRAPARGVRVTIGERASVSVATLRPSVSDAAALARRVVARVEADLPSSHVSADVFPLRGGAALLARASGGEEGARVLLDHMAEVAAEPVTSAEDVPAPEDGPRALARWIGARWASRQDGAPHGGLGVGAVAAGGRADRIGEEDPDASTRAAATSAIGALLERAEPRAIDGIGPEGGDAPVAGVTLRARRLPGAARLSAVVLFEGGAAEDAPNAHGLTALLAQAASDACEPIAQRELGRTLGSMGIEATPLLRADAWGLRVDGPRDRWREVAFLAPRCAAAPVLDPALIEASRAVVLARASTSRESARAAAAAMLAPSSPGRVAPGGSAQALAGIDARELARGRAVRVARARARVAIAGDVPMDDAARVLARGVARWPEGERPSAGPWTPPHERIVAGPSEDHQAIIAWMVEARDGQVAARGFARAVARALASEPGLSERWHDGGGSAGRAWALVAVGATPEALDALPAHVARAMRSVSHAWDAAADEALAEETEQRAWSRSSPRGTATALASASADPPRADEVRRTIAALADGAPYFVLLRPQPGR